MRTIAKYLQPTGFFFLLLHFVAPQLQPGLIVFWMGIAFSALGNFLEIYGVFRVSEKLLAQPRWVYVISTFTKLLLVSTIIYWVFFMPFAYFVLLGSIVIAFLWFFIQIFIKKSKIHSEELLDAE